MRGRRATTMAAVAAVALSLAGCGGDSSPANHLLEPDFGGGTIDASAIDGWPSASPADIPAFPGHVDMVMGGRQSGDSYGVRVFLSGVTVPNLETYLATLVADGYSVVGVVYQSDFEAEADANARAQRGDFDAMEATKGVRELTITVPQTADGQITVDIDGLTQDEAAAMAGPR